MTELEKHLLAGLKKLSEQYAQDMKQLEAQNLRLQQQVQILSEQVQRLSKQQQQVIAALNEEFGG